MRKSLMVVAAALLLPALGALPAHADWVPADGHKMHFPQLPDENGYDVKATYPLILADDFRCSETGWIKDIHFWGSWLHGVPGEIMGFTLSIHADIPADPPAVPYSMPGPILWERDIAQFIAQPVQGGAIEDWYDPETGEVIFNDHTEYWQYNVFLDSLDWFHQEVGTIYWLNITAHVADPTITQWGWKTSLDHFNDDAVWQVAGSGVWNELTEAVFPPVTNLFWGGLDAAGQLLPWSGGINAYGSGWYSYPEEEWWNIWFYDHPFRTDRYKNVVLEFDVFKVDPGLPSFVEIAVNYSTAWWSKVGNPEPAPRVPPLPGCLEDSAIGRVTLLLGPDLQGHFVLPWDFPEYNPEWVSVDIRGSNFMIPEGIGVITHACLPQGEPVSLDLAFVINGGPANVGWDCDGNPPPGKTGGGSESEPNNTCLEADIAQCEYAYCGKIDPLTSQDQDWWRIDLPNVTDICYAVHVRVFGDDTPGQYAYGLGLDPDLTIYSADCSTVLFYNDNHGGVFPDAVGNDAQYDYVDPGNCYLGGTTLYVKVANDGSGTTGPYLLVINCEQCPCPQPPRDTVKCELQGVHNPVHPPTYWYDVTPTQYGRCDFHVEVFDSVLSHYSNFVDPPSWTHALHKAGGKWWVSWWDPNCDSAVFSTFRFQFDNPNPSVWSDWRTTISGTKNPYAQVIDSAGNHAVELDGYGYRIHVPKDIIEPPLTKWEQPPDLTPTGMDVLSSEPMILADDFRCTSTGPITEIHVFGSWLHDLFPGQDPGNVLFTLSLHADIPQGPDGWSIPGPPLWVRQFTPGQFAYQPYALGLAEGWYEPMQSLYDPLGDTQCWEYIFYLEEGEFIQQGTPQAPIVYWLDVQAMPMENGTFFGWKTTPVPNNWNDDAVWGQGPEPNLGPWVEMRYPPMHQWAGQSINQAFIIAGRTPQVTGACCRGHVCTTETQVHCAVGGGYYVQDGWPCVPDPCCCRVMGNLDGSVDNLVTMGDLTILIDHLFITLTPLNCWVEGNMDLSTDYLVTMSDLTILIDHLFITLTPLPACPW